MAHAVEFDAITLKVIVIVVQLLTLYDVLWKIKKIVDRSAYGTPGMVVRSGLSIEPRFRAAHVKFLDSAILGQQFKIAVNSTEADPGKPLSYNLIQLSRCRVRLQLSQFIKTIPKKLGIEH